MSLPKVLESLNPKRCVLSLGYLSPKGTEWVKLYSHLKRFRYLRLETNADLIGLESFKHLRYLALTWNVPVKKTAQRIAKLSELKTLESHIHFETKVVLPQIKNLTINISDTKYLRFFPNVESVTVKGDGYEHTTKIDTRDFPKSLRYLDLSGLKLNITHWNYKDHNIKVLGMMATKIENDFDVAKMYRGIEFVEHDALGKLRRRIDFQSGGKVCDDINESCIKIEEKKIRGILDLLEKNYQPKDKYVHCSQDGPPYWIVLKDNKGGKLVLKFRQGRGVFWKGWNVLYPISIIGSKQIMELIGFSNIDQRCGR
jgi:hypothetical protein